MQATAICPAVLNARGPGAPERRYLALQLMPSAGESRLRFAFHTQSFDRQ
jgi:hypothetical protein